MQTPANTLDATREYQTQDLLACLVSEEKELVLESADGTPAAVHSIASGLDYPGVGPQHSYLKDLGRVDYQSATDQECLHAFMTLSRVEGIIPALESAHAVAWAMRAAPSLGKDQHILVNLSGRGDKDADYVAKVLGL